MTIYTFRCNNCNKPFELDLSFESYMLALTFHCIYCNSENVSRTYEVINVHFKGDDFTKSVKEDE